MNSNILDSSILQAIEKIKKDIELSFDEIIEIDKFFSQKRNHVYLGMILGSNSFNFELLTETILSTFKSNFHYFKSICRKGVKPTIYAGYKKHIDNSSQNFIEIDNQKYPFIWIEKESISKITTCETTSTIFDLNLFYCIDDVLNLSELNKLKHHSNLILVGENKNSFIDLNKFSTNIIDDKTFKEALI